MDQEILGEICLDNNIIVNYLAPDEQNEAVDRLMVTVQQKKRLIYTPALINYEFANTIQRKERMKLISHKCKQAMLKNFFELPIVIMWNEDMIAAALELADRGFPSPYDAAYLAVAMTRKIPLVTLDKSFYKIARAEYPAVFTPDQLINHQ